MHKSGSRHKKQRKRVELIQAYRPTQTEINPLPQSHLSEQCEHGSVGSTVHSNFSLSVILMNSFQDKRIKKSQICSVTN